MSRSLKVTVITAASGILLTGGTITAPAMLEAMNPTRAYTVTSVSVETTKFDLGKFKAGSQYCKVSFIDRISGLDSSVPAPIKMCSILGKGHEIMIKGKDIITSIQP